MKCTSVINPKGDEFLNYCGANMLRNITPEIWNGEAPASGLIRCCGILDDKLVTKVCEPFTTDPHRGHIDIESSRSMLVYDLGSECKIETVAVISYYNAQNDYAVSDFEIYFGNDRETLLNPENLFVHNIAKNEFDGKWTRHGCDFIFKADGSARFFALKINKANSTDDIARICTIGLYSSEFSFPREYCQKHFDYNLLKYFSAIRTDGIKGDISTLYDEICFLDDCSVTAENGASIIYNLNETYSIESISIAASKEVVRGIKLYISETADNIVCDKNAVSYTTEKKEPDKNGNIGAVLKLKEPLAAHYIACVFSESGNIYQLGIHSKTRNITVDTRKRLTDDFISFGVNCVPVNMMEQSLKQGFNNVHMELLRRRIINTRPSVARIWFQLDWIITTREDYENGIYDFDTEKMKAFYLYLDAFKEAGTEVEFNFGWKIGSRVWDWYSFKDVKTKKDSAPADLKSFAKCCSKTVKELIVNRGYDNIKYLTFFNESNFGDLDVGDFLVPDRKPLPYYIKLVRTVLEQMKKDGTRNLVQLWVAEQSGLDDVQFEWTKAMTENFGDELYMNTQHRYDYSYVELMTFFKEHLKAANGGRVALTEFGVSLKNTSWETGHIPYAMAVHNSGYSGALIWTLSGTCLTDPSLFLMDNEFDLFGYTAISGGVEKVNPAFYELGLFMRYIPSHSVSVKTTAVQDDVRVAAFILPNGGMTVAVESKESSHGRELNIDLDNKETLTFYRHTYKRTMARNGNALLPICDKVVEANGKITDTLDSDYQMVLYTTEKPWAQVMLDKVEKQTDIGGSVKIKATAVDSDKPIVWSIIAATNDIAKGIVDENGVYTASENARYGDMIAVRAEIKGEPKHYAVAMITITQSANPT